MRLIDADALVKKVKCRNDRDCANCDFFKDGDSWCDGEIYGTTIMQAPTIFAATEKRRQRLEREHSD